MTKYRTGNAIGSADPRDLYDNAENLDEMVNSQDKTEHPDRLGVPRKTWHGIEEQVDQQEAEFNADQTRREGEFFYAQADKQQRFNAFIAASGYTGTGTNGAVEDYTAGIEISEYNQIIRDPGNGEFWRLSGDTPLPYTTDGSGLPEGGALVGLGDAVLRQDLANPDMGAAMVARGVVAVDSIADLLALPSGQRRAGLRYLVKGYYAGSDVGGGEFYWGASADKSTANGGTVIDPDTTGGFDGSFSTISSFLSAQGSGTGLGCFALLAEQVRLENFGAKEDEDCTVCVQKAADAEASFVCRIGILLQDGINIRHPINMTFSKIQASPSHVQGGTIFKVMSHDVSLSFDEYDGGGSQLSLISLSHTDLATPYPQPIGNNLKVSFGVMHNCTKSGFITLAWRNARPHGIEIVGDYMHSMHGGLGIVLLGAISSRVQISKIDRLRKHVDTTADKWITISDCDQCLVENSFVDRYDADDYSGDAPYFTGSRHCTARNITYNGCVASSGYVFKVSGGSDGILLDNITVLGSADISLMHIHLQGTRNTTVRNCRLDLSAGLGIECGPHPTKGIGDDVNTLIQGCRFNLEGSSRAIKVVSNTSEVENDARVIDCIFKGDTDNGVIDTLGIGSTMEGCYVNMAFTAGGQGSLVNGGVTYFCNNTIIATNVTRLRVQENKLYKDNWIDIEFSSEAGNQAVYIRSYNAEGLTVCGNALSLISNYTPGSLNLLFLAGGNSDAIIRGNTLNANVESSISTVNNLYYFDNVIQGKAPKLSSINNTIVNANYAPAP